MPLRANIIQGFSLRAPDNGFRNTVGSSSSHSLPSKASLKQSVKTGFRSFRISRAPSVSGVLRSSWQERLNSASYIPSISIPAPLTPFPTRKTKRCSDLPEETPKDSVSAENSTSRPDESKGMKLARMRFCCFFFPKREGKVWKFSVCKGGYFAGREMISFYSGVLEMKKINILEGSWGKEKSWGRRNGKGGGRGGKKMP